MFIRQKDWIDNQVQGVLIQRVILYWLCGLIYIGLSTACFQYYQNPDWSVGQHWSALLVQFGPWLPSFVLMLPLVIFDIVRLSNQFVGPVYRLKSHLNAITENANCPPMKFRDEDYWQELVVPINTLQLQILQLKAQLVLTRRRDAQPNPEIQSDLEENETEPSSLPPEDVAESPAVAPTLPPLDISEQEELA